MDIRGTASMIILSVCVILFLCEISKLEMAADDEGDVFEITDFTTASDWERFISRVEEILHEWKLVTSTPKPPAPKGGYTTGNWEERTELLSFADFKFSLTHIWLQEPHDSDHEKSTEKESVEDENEDKDKEIIPTVHGDLMDMDNDFPSRAHCICRWYGLQDFVTLTPASNVEAVLGESKLKILLSSVNIALTDAGCCVPVFIQIHQKWRRLYQGVCVLPGSSVEFGMVHLQRTPPQYNHLAGLLDVFKAKLGSVVDPRPPVSVAVRFLYMLNEWVNSPWSQPLPDFDGEVGCSGFDKLPFGAVEDPVSALNLNCTWPSLSEDMIVENQAYSDLDPMQAPHWSVRIQMTENPQCLLGDYLTRFLALCHRKETLEQLLGNLAQEMRPSDSTGDIGAALQRLTEPSVSYNLPTLASYKPQPSKPTNLRAQHSPLAEDLVNQIMQYLFPDSIKADSVEARTAAEEQTGEKTLHTLPKQLKSAPVDGLLFRLSVCLCVLNHNHGGVLAVAQLWQEFVEEMRYRWEQSILIYGIEAGPPNLGSCILQQKLQMLNCCIQHRKKREQLHSGYSGEPSSPFRGPSTSKVARSLSQEEAINSNRSINRSWASATKNENREDPSKKTHQSIDSPTKRNVNSKRSNTDKPTEGQRSGSTGDSSEDEFFECNDARSDSDEKDIDTASENQSTEMTETGNLSETEMDCETGDQSRNMTEPSSETTQVAGMENSRTMESLGNLSGMSDSQYKESFTHTPEGRLAAFENQRLINCDEMMYVPVTQEPAPMTEDMLEEHAEILAKLGTSAEGAELRARMQSACLLSDMESFKAANPGCVLEDFVRWYSPRDWIEADVEDEHGKTSSTGHLSQRMLIPGNMWVEVWQTARPVPAQRQKRLFDDTKEAEKVLHYLSSLKPADVVVLLMPCLLHAALLRAMENDDQNSPVLKQVIEQTSLKASQVTRAPQQEAKRYEECIRMLIHAEVLISRNQSLQNKFHPDLLEHSDARAELQVFVSSILHNSEVAVRGGPMGPAGTVISRIFQAAMRSSYMILDDDDTTPATSQLKQDDSSHNSSVPSFPRPSAREYILRTIVPRPAPYSRTLPQRMYCSIQEEEFRLAGAFCSDSVFQ